MTLLDFSCGTGRNILYMANRGFDVYGFDKFHVAVSYTKAILKKEHLNAKVIVADMQRRLPYEDGFFDAVIIIRAMYHTKVKVIRKIANDVVRITRPGGFIYIESDQRSTIGEDTTEYKRVSRGTYLYVKGDWKGYYYHVFNKQELLTLFKRCKVLQFYFKSDNFHMLVQKDGI